MVSLLGSQVIVLYCYEEMFTTAELYVTFS